MPKIKTNRATAKRFKKTATGKIKRRSMNMRHILNKKSSKRKRHLRQATLVCKADHPAISRLMPY
ncbi:50S ribosomal protein L35 [bacterium AH-315-J21]|nr:50S ribosomal protein L35 [bacterium AH-315-J21]